MSKKRRSNFNKISTQSEQKFYCPLCAGFGNQVALDMFVDFVPKTVEPGTEVYERERCGNKWIDKLKYTTKTEEVFYKRVKKLRCPVCGVVYPMAQFFRKKNNSKQ